MKRVMGHLKYLFFLLFVIQGNSYAWWSLELAGISTHKRITTNVIDALNYTGNYADMHKFSGTIIDGTSSIGNDSNAHGLLLVGDTTYPLADQASKFDGGPFNLWYAKGLENYKNGKFIGGTDSSYYYFALMAHLVED